MRLKLLHNHGQPGVIASETSTTTHSTCTTHASVMCPVTHTPLVRFGHRNGMLVNSSDCLHAQAHAILLRFGGILREYTLLHYAGLFCHGTDCSRRLRLAILLEEIDNGVVVIVNPLARHLAATTAGEDRAHWIDCRRLW